MSAFAAEEAIIETGTTEIPVDSAAGTETLPIDQEVGAETEPPEIDDSSAGNPESEKPEEGVKEEPNSGSQTSSLESEDDIFDQKEMPGSTDQKIDTDAATGALSYSYPLTIPPGRNGMQPNMSLSYNSQASSDGGLLGSRWTLEIPSISRVNKHGIAQMYSEENFSSSMSGELVKLSAGIFASKTDNGDFLNYSFSNNSWVVKDKWGTVHTYGAIAAARQDNPSDTSKVSKWMLQESRDTNGNFVTYEYFKHLGQIYPSKITYTGNGTSAGIFEVNLLRESRNDVLKSYGTGFLVQSSYRINEINAKVSGLLARKYSFSFAAGGNGVRSLLTSVTETGYDDSGTAASLPPVTFTYQQSQKVWNSWQHFSNTEGFNGPIGADTTGFSTADVNGDSLSDVVRGYYWDSDEESDRQAYVNSGNLAWSDDDDLHLPYDLTEITSHGSAANSPDRTLVDVNGDGFPGLLWRRRRSSLPARRPTLRLTRTTPSAT